MITLAEKIEVTVDHINNLMEITPRDIDFSKILQEFAASIVKNNCALPVVGVSEERTEVCEHDYKHTHAEAYTCTKCGDIYIDT